MKTILLLMTIAVMFTAVGCQDEIDTPTQKPILGERIVYTKYDRADPNSVVHGVSIDSNAGDPRDFGFGAIYDVHNSKLLMIFGNQATEQVTGMAVCNIDGSYDHMIDPSIFGELSGFPALSPDGSKIAFYNDDQGYKALYIINADGSGKRLISNSIRRETKLCFSPDGSKIAYYVDTTTDDIIEPEGAIEVSTVDGSLKYELVKVSSIASDLHATISWSVNDKIAYSDDMIMIINANGTNAHPVAEGFGPSWNADGSTLAFASDAGIRTTKDEGFTIDSYPFTAQQSCETVSWSPDGTRILYESWLGNKEHSTTTLREVTLANGNVRIMASPAMLGFYMK